VEHYKQVCAYLKENTLFKRLTITGDVQNVSLLLLNNTVLINACSTTHVAAMAR
jgi:hypothetical protein